MASLSLKSYVVMTTLLLDILYRAMMGVGNRAMMGVGNRAMMGVGNMYIILVSKDTTVCW